MKKHSLFILFSIFSFSAFSQTISGRITDDSGNSIPNAYIYCPEGKVHGHSNNLGHFSLSDIEVGESIVVSYLGFKKIEKEISEEDFNRELNLVLEEEFFDLEQISISNSLKTINKVASIDLQTSPVSSSQEILRKVPGLFIGQHAGGGKAEQIFLRGFDIDHGTDIAISVDGMPVNMVSHAHGQGYADLHFLIPETIENIDFGKGPYYSDHGNFNTAGYVDFKTKDRIDKSMVGLEYGQFNTARTFGMFDLLGNSENQNAYLAAEYLQTDGPVKSPQNFNRLNLMGKYSSEFQNGDRLSLLVSRFQSKWDASGQIPQRLVDNGTISRFGSVDDTEGGNTSRTNFAMDHTKVLSKNSFLNTNAFFSQYDFELFSNFTFFLEDPVNGDQIRQTENRKIYGVQTKIFQSMTAGAADLEMSYGAGFRYDDVNGNELSHTKNRKTTLESYALGNVDETNMHAFANAEFSFEKWMINPGLRLDVFNFDYQNQLTPTYTSLSENKAMLSPKFNVLYNPNVHWQLFFKSGTGFHSNDTRVVVEQNGKEILPAAYGADLGAIWKPLPRIWVNAAAWYLFLEQEFVYVGDAGIVEPSGETERKGIDLGLRWQLTDNLFFDSDFNYTHSKALDAEVGENRIPLAPQMTAAGGFSYKTPKGFSGGLRYRFIKDRPANEDNSIVADGFFILDANAAYRFKNVRFRLNVENMLNSEWNEAQFATESRLFDETESVEEIHFTPGTPFFVKGSLRYEF